MRRTSVLDLIRKINYYQKVEKFFTVTSIHCYPPFVKTTYDILVKKSNSLARKIDELRRFC